MSDAKEIAGKLAGLGTVLECDHAARGWHLELSLVPEQLPAAAEVLDQGGFFIETIVGVDWLGEQEALAKEAAKAAAAKAAAAKKAAEKAAQETAERGEPAPEPPPPAAEEVAAEPAATEPREDSFEVIYHFNRYEQLCRVLVRCRVPRSLAKVPTISGIYPGANWHERETHDFFGIEFSGHPDLSPLLLPEDADFHPLRKDYQP